MSFSFATLAGGSLRPRRETLRWGAVLVGAELLLVGIYLSLADVTPTALRYYAYPFVWINVAVWAVVRTTRAPAGTRQRRIAGALAVGYFAVLAYAGGLVGTGHALHGHTHAMGFRLIVESVPPGWGPALLYNGAWVKLTLLPFKVVGYVALAYLVYATVIDAAGSALGGLLGLLSCVSCTWPVLASVVSGLLGSTTAIAGAIYAGSYDLSTAVFVLTVALLYWRPFGR